MSKFLLVIVPFFCLLSFSGQAQKKLEQKFNDSLFQKIKSLYPAKTEAHMGDWLSEHPEEHQSFDDYVKDKPVRPTAGKNKIYILPLGDFSAKQSEIVTKTVAFLKVFYGLEVVKLETLKDSVIYEDSRINGYSGKLQLYTQHLLEKVLKPRLPADGVVMIGLTAIDLYPDKKWNYVFGQATLEDRVGVWSMNRDGDPSVSEEAFNLCLSRTIKTATHEIGHMFGITHCTEQECCMNGSNNLKESDRAPRWFCWECLQKICWNMGLDPKTHFTQVGKFWEDQGSKNYAEFYKKNLAAIKN